MEYKYGITAMDAFASFSLDYGRGEYRHTCILRLRSLSSSYKLDTCTDTFRRPVQREQGYISFY